MATEAEIDAFLRRFRAAVQNRGLTLWPTAKNNQFLLDTGFTNKDVLEIVNALTATDYSSGPEPDDNPKRAAGEVWKFNREHVGYELYIKLKLHSANPVAECMSCHEAEGEMRQPIRQKRRKG